MKMTRRRLTLAGCILLGLAALGCSEEPRGWTPVLEETSTLFLKSEAEMIASRVQSARTQLPANPELADADLAVAEEGLDHLLTYYLPLVEAREHAYGAYRRHSLGEIDATGRELNQVESILVTVSKAGDGHLLRDMKEPLGHLEDARAALGADTAAATEALGALASRLNFLLLKGGLVLSN